MNDRLSSDMQSGALVYHSHPRPGKLEISATKPLGNQRDLALAYSPGVAVACEAIVDDPGQAAELTFGGRSSFALPISALRQIEPDVKLTQLLHGYFRRRAHQQIFGTLVHRE